MTFPFPVMLNSHEWGNSLWTDFTDKWNGPTYLGSYAPGAMMPDWSKSIGGSSVSEVIEMVGSLSGQAYMHLAALDTGTVIALLWGASPASVNADVLLGFRIDQYSPIVNDGAGIRCRVSPSGEIASHLTGNSANERNWIAFASSDGVNSSTSTDNYAWLPFQWYWMRLNASGGAVKIKVWQRGSSEPSSWTVEWSPAFITSAPGQAGIILGGASVSEQYIDFFSVCTDGAPAWGPV